MAAFAPLFCSVLRSVKEIKSKKKCEHKVSVYMSAKTDTFKYIKTNLNTNSVQVLRPSEVEHTVIN